MDAKEAASKFINMEKNAQQVLPPTEPVSTSTTARTEFDAVHQRFRNPVKPEDMEAYQVSNDYYCKQCKMFFAPDFVGLKNHFRFGMVRHVPINKCFYCEAPVYEYSFNKERKLYHNCVEKY